MIRNLAQCPYCGNCEIALDDSPAVAFNPGGASRSCSHLAWVDGRYSQWDGSPQGTNRVIGSMEFRWAPPALEAGDPSDELLAYLTELVNQGPKWEFAPPAGFVLRTLSAEEKRTDGDGNPHTMWDVDGWAIFAPDAAAFWAALPAAQERQLQGLQVAEES